MTANKTTRMNGVCLNLVNFKDVFFQDDPIIVVKYSEPDRQILDLEWGHKGLAPHTDTVFWGWVLKQNKPDAVTSYVIGTDYSAFHVHRGVTWGILHQFSTGLLRVRNSTVGHFAEKWASCHQEMAAIKVERAVRGGMVGRTTKGHKVFINGTVLRKGGYLTRQQLRKNLVGHEATGLITHNVGRRPYTFQTLTIHFDHLDNIKGQGGWDAPYIQGEAPACLPDTDTTDSTKEGEEESEESSDSSI